MKLKDICEFIIDCPHSTATDEGAGYPLIRTPNIGKGRLDLTNVHRVSKKVYDARNARAIPRTGDLIFAREAPAGNIAVIQKDQKVCLGQRTVLIRPKNDVDPNYLAYYILAPQQQYKLLGSANGATVAHVNLPIIRNMSVDLPEYSEQKRISSVLSCFDDLVDINNQQISLLEEAAQRLYKEWFIDLHFPGYENCKFVDGVPNGWKLISLESIAPIKTGKKDANYGTNDGRYPFFTCAQEPIKSPGYSFDCNAVILAGNGDFNVKLYRGKFEAYQRTYIFTPKQDEYLFLLYYSVVFNMRNLFKAASGSTIKFLTKRMLQDIKVIVPSRDILHTFNMYENSFQNEIEILKDINNDLCESRDRLLPKLMSGEIEA